MDYSLQLISVSAFHIVWNMYDVSSFSCAKSTFGPPRMLYSITLAFVSGFSGMMHDSEKKCCNMCKDD